jgi:hypothetical protein
MSHVISQIFNLTGRPIVLNDGRAATILEQTGPGSFLVQVVNGQCCSMDRCDFTLPPLPRVFRRGAEGCDGDPRFAYEDEPDFVNKFVRKT